jgi:fatty acid-binding protein DegV
MAIHKIGFNMDNHNNYINGINISKNKLRFNILFLDDEYLNQFIYHDLKNLNKIKISNIKSNHLINIIEKLKNGNYKDVIYTTNI